MRRALNLGLDVVLGQHLRCISMLGPSFELSKSATSMHSKWNARLPLSLSCFLFVCGLSWGLVEWDCYPDVELFCVSREAARECRRKKKEYIKCLENRVAVLENQNKALIDELKSLKELYCQQKVEWRNVGAAFPPSPQRMLLLSKNQLPQFVSELLTRYSAIQELWWLAFT